LHIRIAVQNFLKALPHRRLDDAIVIVARTTNDKGVQGGPHVSEPRMRGIGADRKVPVDLELLFVLGLASEYLESHISVSTRRGELPAGLACDEEGLPT